MPEAKCSLKLSLPGRTIYFVILSNTGFKLLLIDDDKNELQSFCEKIGIKEVDVDDCIEEKEITLPQAERPRDEAIKETVLNEIKVLEPKLLILDDHLPYKGIGSDVAKDMSHDFPTIIYSRSMEQFSGGEKFICWYQKETHDHLLLKGLRSCWQQAKVENGFFECSNAIEYLSVLKHRVAHLFLSIDVDLQGIGALTGQRKREMKETQNTPEDYLKDVLEGKNGDYYRQKLADLQFMVAKVNMGEEKPSINCNGKASGNLAKAGISEENLPGGKFILGLIPEEKRDDENIMSLSQCLLILSGLTFEDNRNLFKNITSGHKSPIFKFMCLMDCEIDKKDNIGEEDVNDVMDFFAKIEGGKVWTVKGANPSPINSFNDWFCALVDCLENLRKVIKPD